MELSKIWEKYAPNFTAGLMTAILISMILGYNPLDIGWLTLLLWVVGLYFFGILLTWILLWKFK